MKISKAGITAAYMLLGGAIGTAAGMLLAPQSGAATRERIAARMKEGTDSIGAGVKAVQDQLVKTGEKIGSSSTRLISRGRATITGQGKDTVAEAIDAAKRAYLEEKDVWMLKRK